MSLVIPLARRQARKWWVPRNALCFRRMVVMTAVKRLLRSMRLVVLCVMLALFRFTVRLTLVLCSVGVLPILLLATVMIRFWFRRV